MTSINYENLSDDSAVAFAEIVEQFDERLARELENYGDRGDTRTALIEYMNNILAAARALEISDFDRWSVPEYDRAYDDHRMFSLEVKNFVLRTRIAKARVAKVYSVALDSPTKTKIHHFIDRIRAILQEADLTDRKRNSLMMKLNAFAADVDRARTKFENAMLVMIDLTDIAKRGTETLKPITELVNSITALIGEAKNNEPEPESLPAPEERKRIEGPKEPSKGFSRDLDDEIPF